MLTKCVLIPAYNCEDTIEETIESVLSQTLIPDEIIIINDGSKDGTRKILEDKYSSNKIIRIVHKVNGGIVEALNLGLSITDCDLIFRIDSDDLMRCDRIEIQYHYMVSNSDIVLCGSYLENIDEHGVSLGMRTYPVTAEEIRDKSKFENPVAHPSIVFRRSACIESGGYSKSYPFAEDYSLWLRMLERGNFHNIPLPLTQYRIHPNQSKSYALRIQLASTIKIHFHHFISGGEGRYLHGITCILLTVLFFIPNFMITFLYKLKTGIKG